MFGSALALMPLLMAAVAILACFLAVFGLTEITSVSVIVQYLVALIGLGVAIDYSLLLVTRWREELAAGRASEDAVTRAMATAGRSILFSGGTVAIGLLSLVLLPVPALRSIGIGGMLVPAVSVAVTVTLLPVLLATAGQRMDWPRRRRTAAASRGWARWARLVVRRKWAATAAALVVLGLLGAAASGIKVGEPAAAALGTTTPAAQALRSLERAGFPPGCSTRWRSSPRPARTPHSSPVGSPHCPGAHRRRPRRPGLAARRNRPDQCPASRRAVHRRRGRGPGARPPGRGQRAGHADRRGRRAAAENHAFYGRFPLLIAVLAAVTILLLARAFGSLLLPVKAVILNLASVGATYG